MPRETKNLAGPELRTLFEAGTTVGRSDGELLDRFLTAGGPTAELAFAALVERHGPMIWRVCRDVLRESNDADDAFQATILVLARRAGAIRNRSSLGPWLYGVALRVARSARRRAARRRDHEQGTAEPEREGSMADAVQLDAAPIVHEEVGRLPEKYRAPLVLCYFEGLTHDQAASQLGWPVGTVRSRLAVARDRLRPRLLRRGVAPSVAILTATGLPESSAAVPATLVSAAIGMAVGAKAGAGAAGTVPASVAALVGTVLREMTLMKTTMIATSLVAAFVGTAGVGYVAVAARPQGAEQAVTPKQDDQPPKANAAPAASTDTAPGRDRSTTPASNNRPSANSARTLWAKLNAAVSTFRTFEKQFSQARILYSEVARARGEVEALAAELSSSADDLRDEVELLQAQLEIKKADVQAAEAQLARTMVKFKQAEKLLHQKVVSQTDVDLHHQEVNIHSAELAKKQAEMNEVVLRIKQATRRRDEAAALVERAKGLLPEPESTPKPTADAAKP